MKLFSQIDPISSQNRRADSNNQLFSFHQNYIPSQTISNNNSQYKSQKSKNKFSFKLQPELYFQKKTEQKQRLYQNKSHISILSQSEHSSINDQPKTQYSRKKIFNNDLRVTYLQDQQNSLGKVQGKNMVPINKLPQNNQIVKKDQQKLTKQIKQQERFIKQQIRQADLQLPINVNRTINSSYENINRNGRKINKVSFNHEQSNRYLMNPILQQPSIPQFNQKVNPAVQNLTRTYPKLIERVEHNEQQIMDLSKRLDNKILQDSKKQQYLMKLLAQKDRQSHQKDIQLQYYRKKNIQRQKMNLQIQQATRLQQLILQNKHLTLKVQKEQQRITQQKALEDIQKINQRIEELKKMRQLQLQNNTNTINHSFNLDRSIIPHHYLGDEPSTKPLVNILRTHNKESSLLPLKKVTFQQPYFSQNNLIPERDNVHNQSAVKTKQIFVPLTRIY